MKIDAIEWVDAKYTGVCDKHDPSPAQKHNVKEKTQFLISFEPKFIIFVLIESLYNPKYNSEKS